MLQAEQMHKMTSISLKMVKVVILSENSCHFVNLLSFASSSFFLSLRKITWLNSQQPKTRGHVEHPSYWYLKLKFVSNTFWTKNPKSSHCVLKVVLPNFHWQNKYKIIISAHFSVRTKMLITIKVRKLSFLALKCTFLGQNRLPLTF